MRDPEIISTFVEQNFIKGRQFIHTIGKELTPCYLFEPAVVKSRAKAFKRAFQYHLPDTSFYYAVKSNNFPDVSQAAIESGFGLDVSSGAELEMALEIGAKDIVFSGPGKTESELDIAVIHSGKVKVLMDSFTELKRLEKRAAKADRKVRAGVRINSDPKGLWRKFGILLHDLNDFIQMSKNCPHISFQGIQFHSSWNMGPEKQVAFIKELGQTIASLSASDKKMIRFIDIGGGYWPEQGEWLHVSSANKNNLNPELHINCAVSIEDFAMEISRALFENIHNQIGCRICFEPGRWICNNSMHIILKVIDKKYHNMVITDGGTNAVGWERFETDYFPVLNLSRPEIKERECLILGSLCTPHDVWGYRYWGKDIQEGDILMIPTQGAYTYSLRQNFIKDVPQVIVFP
ncbi:Orn/DAP/Arg decarboxylase 2 [Desulfamplus magnetovallimortis]|uniref:Orn/DAP/Arg decarboxylase 2 n=1 Tax=Desulfamplus magnetovallimortis TaxID=1246637 RepID=A0A1W1HEU3_9BACT|nr:alanine racemase [Desulfamplus magnetovallimortis]SLM31007.1 Orn/DAP/Arg decarboxylase 2 [Desulfamplus magnetovallimortis]